MQKQTSQHKAFFITALLFFLSFASAAYALEVSYSQASLDLCSCSNYTNQIYVTNNVAMQITASIKSSNSASGFVKIPVKSSDLYPGETKAITEKISIPCGFVGQYVLDTTIKDGLTAKKIRQRINVKNCYAIKLEIEKNQDKICYEQKNYTVKVKNKGTTAQIINLSLKEKNAQLDKNSIMLDPGQETTAILAIEPFNASEKTYAIKAKTKISESTSSLNVVSIANNDCYKLAFNIPDIKTDYSQKTIRIRFENKGIKEGNYVLSIEPDWLFLDETAFNLAPKQVKEIAIVASPLGISQGIYEGKITVTELNSGEVYEKIFTITVKEKDQTWNIIRRSMIIFWIFIKDHWFRILSGIIILFLLYLLIKKIISKIKKAIKIIQRKREKEELRVIRINHKEEKIIRKIESKKVKEKDVIKKILLTISTILAVGIIYFIFYYFKI